MKIAIAVTVNVDPEKWAETFGCAREDVREDVQTYFAEGCIEQLNHLECAAERNPLAFRNFS